MALTKPAKSPKRNETNPGTNSRGKKKKKKKTTGSGNCSGVRVAVNIHAPVRPSNGLASLPTFDMVTIMRHRLVSRRLFIYLTSEAAEYETSNKIKKIPGRTLSDAVKE